jgi:triosephosphate isomerase
MRTRMLAGNWKMNKLNGELPAYFEAFGRELGRAPAGVDVLFAVPFTLLAQAAEVAKPRGFRVAAQNVHWEASGAYTGEVSLAMIKEVGATATLIGHSERRQYFGETDEGVAKKTLAALTNGVVPIVCVGETLAEREDGRTAQVVSRQLAAVMSQVAGPLVPPAELIIAYEPVWAIGTGRSATTAQAQEVHQQIRGIWTEKYGPAAGAAIRILYGGSASPANISELLAQPDIDGGLVGGASLKPVDFAKMALAAARV